MRHFFCDSLKRFLMACVLTVVGIFSAHAANLPSGYTELEYIENDGASYLIVPYRVNNKTVFYCRYNEYANGTNVANAVFGVTDQPSVSNANNGILRLTGSGFNRMGWGNTISGSIIEVGNAPKVFDTWYEVLYDQNKLYQDGTLYATSATAPSTVWSANYNLGIFARNSANVTMIAKAKISSVWAKEAGVFVLNLVPAKRDSDGVLGMYDTVNDVFYTKRGSGTFTAGPEVIVPEIKIATTKYTEDAFAGLVATLNSAIDKVTNIVDDTVQQATEIGVLAETKQDRPDTDCPAGRKCLLIMGADNKPHWYLIQE